MTTTSAILADGVGQRFGNVVALDGLDLEVEAGSVFGLCLRDHLSGHQIGQDRRAAAIDVLRELRSWRFAFPALVRPEVAETELDAPQLHASTSNGVLVLLVLGLPPAVRRPGDTCRSPPARTPEPALLVPSRGATMHSMVRNFPTVIHLR
jgi:hypothetical protein